MAAACGCSATSPTSPWTSNGVENIQVNALGGADTIVVNDLTGTDAKQVNIDLSGTAGSGQGDGAADNVIVNGTAGDDTVTVASSGAG